MNSERNILKFLTEEQSAEQDRVFDSYNRISDRKKSRVKQAFKAMRWMITRR